MRQKSISELEIPHQLKLLCKREEDRARVFFVKNPELFVQLILESSSQKGTPHPEAGDTDEKYVFPHLDEDLRTGIAELSRYFGDDLEAHWNFYHKLMAEPQKSIAVKYGATSQTAEEFRKKADLAFGDKMAAFNEAADLVLWHLIEKMPDFKPVIKGSDRVPDEKIAMVKDLRIRMRLFKVMPNYKLCEKLASRLWYLRKSGIALSAKQHLGKFSAEEEPAIRIRIEGPVPDQG
jgi:hypothetical protein